MMLATKAWYWGKISTDAAILAQLGGITHLSDMRPEVISIFPMVILTDDGQNDREFADNKPKAVKVSIKVDIYTKAIAGAVTTSDIGINIARVLDSMYFTCIGNRETPEPLDSVRHRVMRFSRDLFPSDLT
jgi:hypothetical protein